MTVNIDSAEAALTILEEYVSQAPGSDKDMLAACAYLRRATWTPAPGDVDARLAEIESRANAATPGEWTFKIHEDIFVDIFSLSDPLRSLIASLPYDDCHNHEFIAHARADIPFLLSLVKPMHAATEKFNAAKRYIATLTRVIKSLGPSLPYVELTQALREYEAATGENAMENAETIIPRIDLDRETVFGSLMLGESFWYQGEKAIKQTDSTGSFTGGQILPFNEYDIVQTCPPLNNEVSQ